MRRQSSNEHFNQSLHARLERAAPDFPYPTPPNIEQRVKQQLARETSSGPVRSMRWGWAVVAVTLLSLGLLAVPPVRAALWEVLQLGSVRIFLAEPTPTATSRPSTSGSLPPKTATPVNSILELAGETSLAEAQDQGNYVIKLPTYPADLGQPDRVFVQDFAGPVIILVWLDPNDPERVRLSLHMLGPNTYAQKLQPKRIESSEVRGQPALWAQGPYLLQFQQGNTTVINPGRLINGHVLIWLEDEITYRLETDLPMAEAVRIAESLR
ncbi:MAG: hypothetical protein KDJ65_36720 [Anaerolineae bacterium]|nr:hypothetical protein [Anaerolineae bacterium]